MQFRDILHRVALLAAFVTTLALPTEVFDGYTTIITTTAGFIGMVLTFYLGQTTTGVAQSELPPHLAEAVQDIKDAR